MISNIIVGNALNWWSPNSGVEDSPVAIWRKARNEWLRAQGIRGIIKDGKRSRSIPPWWADGTQFWFDDEIDEQIFTDKWK